jgi:hypothetical protein
VARQQVNLRPRSAAGWPVLPGYARGVPGHHPLVPAFDDAAVPLGEVLDRQVELLREAHHAGQPVAAELLRGTGTVPSGPELTLEAARLAIARDNIVLAAALGDLAAVRGYFGPDGMLRPNQAHLRIGVGGPELAATHLVEFALIQAAGHGRREVVGFLLGKQPDLTVTEPFFGSTARGMAGYRGYPEIAALIAG